MMNRPAHITILGGGPAGLAVGYYAKKNGVPFTIYEAANRTGGNCVTLRHGDFLFDSGAHRLHDKDEEITREIKSLLGNELTKITAPSFIFQNNRFIHFPLSPLNLLQYLGPLTFAKAACEVAAARLRPRKTADSFEGFALHTYGKTIAGRFLLNYSEKLWGLPCHRLSRNIGGNRLKSLDLRTFITEAVLGKKARAGHMEGSFYYPRAGYGTIAEKMEAFCGQEHIQKNARITRILHSNHRIQAVEINQKQLIDTDAVVSTLPLDLFLKQMDPAPPKEISKLAQSIRYRNIILVAAFIRKASITEAATVYFPDPSAPFTRVYEPRNRSACMSPSGKTSLVAEIPCQEGDELWNLQDGTLSQNVLSYLTGIGWVQRRDILDTAVIRMKHAYPVLEIDFEEKIHRIHAFLGGCANLKLSGRSGKFVYAWLHNMMRFGKEIVEEHVRDPA